MSNGKKLVLIIDDTPTNITVVSGVLKDQYRIKIATNREKALSLAAGQETSRFARSQKPLDLAEREGFESSERLRAQRFSSSKTLMLASAE